MRLFTGTALLFLIGFHFFVIFHIKHILFSNSFWFLLGDKISRAFSLVRNMSQDILFHPSRSKD
jgi:hypothetical protein